MDTTTLLRIQRANNVRHTSREPADATAYAVARVGERHNCHLENTTSYKNFDSLN